MMERAIYEIVATQPDIDSDDTLPRKESAGRNRVISLRKALAVAILVVLVMGIPFAFSYVSMETTITDLRNENAALTQSVSNYQAQVGSLEGQMGGLAGQLESLEEQYTTLQSSLTFLPSNSSAIRLDSHMTWRNITSSFTIELDVQLFNTLAVPNNVLNSGNWPLPVGSLLSRPSCAAYPVAFEMLRGYYSASNVSQGAPLVIFDPRPVPCALGPNYANITFYPSSSTALVFAPFGNSSYPPLTLNMSWTVQITGYWIVSQNSVMVHPFEPGTYSIVVADTWGVMDLLYLTY